MPQREQLFGELQDEKDVGVLLVVQLGGVPNELQLIVQTARMDEAAEGLRERNSYIIRVLGVREHRASVGVFGTLFIAENHPILFHHNEAMHEVTFSGKPADTNELVLDIQSAYGATFGPWRDLAEDLNREKPLFDLLSSGEGVLGRMPQPAAERVVRVLEHHKLTASSKEIDAGRAGADEHGRERRLKLLGIDDSYFIAYDFSIETMAKR